MPNINLKSYEATPSRKVAFLGLGVMGYPMAGHLAQAGHEVNVFNRTSTKSVAWYAEYTRATGQNDQKNVLNHAATPRAAVQGADIVFCCVGNDADLRSVVLGEDLGNGARGISAAPGGFMARKQEKVNSYMKQAEAAHARNEHVYKVRVSQCAYQTEHLC